MSTETDVRERVERASEAVGPVWPLYSFVTANPLAGFEDQPFREAVRRGAALYGGRGYPRADTFRRAWEAGRIDPDVLAETLAEHGYDAPPAELLDRMERESSPAAEFEATATDRVDRVLCRWLAAFLDEGRAEWSMPDRETGFYGAVRSLAPHDSGVPGDPLGDLPVEPVAALEELLADLPPDRRQPVLEHHLTALPGWTGLIKRRAGDGGDWQAAHPITLVGYLAVRLAVADALGAPRDPGTAPESGAASGGPGDPPLAELWLVAWEATYRRELVGAVTEAADALEPDDRRPAAQLVFCIDTRSEVLRRHLEVVGEYETHGYAGFFGVPMRYEGYGAPASVDACPPIVDARHRIADRPAEDGSARADHDHWTGIREAAGAVIESLKTNAATAFSFVESAGSGYGAALAARTLLPGRVYDLLSAADDRVPATHEFCAPALEHDPGAGGELPAGLSHEEMVEYAASAFELMGVERFARLFVFTGHASETANNPFDASLDCGACAGNPGGPNARVLAAICNDDDVQDSLRERGIEVPGDTVFLAAEHNTTTDEVTLFDGDVPDSHADDLERLRADLTAAREGATAERAPTMGADPTQGVRETERRAADWAQTRPEWGLAGNAAFVVGPRGLTDGLDLDGRAFLHSYDPATDPDGEALEAIMAGPMVVTQWINSQYYFATVDSAAYGAGSKVTHNPVGNVGVYQGNGGDLMTGLPEQSLLAADGTPYHQPLRLSVVIHAPLERVTGVLARNDHLQSLLDNGWLSLTVVDPEQGCRAFRYDGDFYRPNRTVLEHRTDEGYRFELEASL